MASSILNFSPDRLITGINIIDGMLFFVDNATEPKKINIEQFKNSDLKQYGNANHDNPTTSIYGRPFEERDITVIRPHPMGFDVSLSSSSTDINGDAVRPLVTTLPAKVEISTARLEGLSNNGQTNITARGFYYVKKDDATTTLTTSYIVANGTKVDANNSGDLFSARITGLTANSKYQYFAFAQNGVDTRIDGDVVPFTAGGVTFGLPTVTTISAVKDSERSFTFTGKVTNTGDSPLLNYGFYVKSQDFLDLNVPSDLSTDTDVIEIFASDISVDNTFSNQFQVYGSGNWFYQAFAENSESGIGLGAVRSSAIRGTQGPEVEVLPARQYGSGNNAILVGNITEPRGEIIERGFIISKQARNKVTLVGGEATNPYITKVIVPINAFDVVGEFEYTTVNMAGTLGDVPAGESLFYMAYAINDTNTTGYSAVGEYFKPQADSEVPSIILENVRYQGGGTDPKLLIEAELMDSGRSSSTSVADMGFIVTSVDEGSYFPAYTNPTARKEFMLQQLAAGKADKVQFSKYTGLPGILDTYELITSGTAANTFSGSDVVPMESGKNYYVMAYANNGQYVGYSLAKGVFNETTGNAPNFKTLRAIAQANTTSLILHGEIKDRIAGATVYDAGFRIVAGVNTAIDSLGANNHNIGATTSQTGATNTGVGLQAFNNSGTGSGKFSVTVNGLQAQTTYLVQAWIQPTAGGGKVYASNSEYIPGLEAGVVSVVTLSFPSALPKPNCQATSVGSLQARFMCNYVNKGGVDDKIVPEMSPKFYYRKVADTTGSTNALKQENIRNAAVGATADSNKGIISGITDFEAAAGTGPLADDFWADMGATIDNGFYSTSNPKLTPDTEYYLFASVNNGIATQNGNFVAGEGISNLVSFKTESAAGRVGFPTQEKSSKRSSSKWNVKAFANGEDNDYSVRGFYYIKASELVTNSVQGVVSEGTFVAANSRNQNPFSGLIPVEPQTDYKWVAVLTNDQGTGYSAEIQTIDNTIQENRPATISLERDEMRFAASGAGLSIDNESTNRINVSPTDSGFSFQVNPWSGNSQYEDLRPQVTQITLADGTPALKVQCQKYIKNVPRTSRVHVKHGKYPNLAATLVIHQSAAGGIVISPWNFGPRNYGGGPLPGNGGGISAGDIIL